MTHAIRVGRFQFVYWKDIGLAVITAPGDGDSKPVSIVMWNVKQGQKRILQFIGGRPFRQVGWSEVTDFWRLARMGQKYLDNMKYM